MDATRCLLLFTKPPAPGRVKTRLIGTLTPAEAARLHEAFLLDVAEELARGDFELRVAWALDSGGAMPERPGPGIRQQGRDLGERLWRGLRRAGRNYPLVGAVGSDHPAIEHRRVEEAFERLEDGADLVLAPAEDGGYTLVAARADRLRRELFAEVPWSTGEVLATTLERAEDLELEVELLPTAWDVDTPPDLDRLAGWLAAHQEPCPRTRALLASWGRLEEGSRGDGEDGAGGRGGRSGSAGGGG